MLEFKIRNVLAKLSNNEGSELYVDPQWIEDAGESFKQALTRQFTRTDEPPRLRMSNIGRPTCQLQMAMAGEKEVRKPYNFIMRMLHGDAVEAIMEVVLRVAQANITGGKNKVELKVGDTVIKGEDDIEIDGKVYDIKSCSPFAYIHKWHQGYENLKNDDTFGYLGQLYGYSTAQDKEAGGWIVVDKSSGEVCVVDAKIHGQEKQRLKQVVEDTVATISEGRPFKRCFEAEDDKFKATSTGLKRLSISCSFCDFVKVCWPTAEYKPHPHSKAKKPPYYWFVTEE